MGGGNCWIVLPSYRHGPYNENYVWAAHLLVDERSKVAYHPLEIFYNEEEAQREAKRRTTANHAF